MKRIKLLFLLFLIITFTSCGTQNDKVDVSGFSTINMVKLPTYQNYIFQRTDFQVTESDLNTYVYYELLSKQILPENYDGNYLDLLTDTIAKDYYECNSTEELLLLFTKEIELHRKWDIFFQYIKEYCIVDEKNSFFLSYIDSVYKTEKMNAEKQGMEFEKYLKETYEQTLDEFDNLIRDDYISFLLIKAVAETENIYCDEQSFTKTLTDLSSQYNISKDEFLLYYGSNAVLSEYYKTQLMYNFIPKFNEK